MYAVIQTGGKQYRVAVGDRLKVESLPAEPGDSIELDKVLMISDNENVQVGTPILEGQSVSAQVVDNGRGEKIKVFKMQRRQGYRRTQGHRQNFTEIEITAIAGRGRADSDSGQLKALEAEKQTAPPVDTEAAGTESGETARPVGDEHSTVDDLTRINGIGPVISEKLNSLGYTRFAQIAALDQAGVEDIEAQLSFKGRIERENWIQQAIELSK